jgi:hypothetical protein
MDLLRPSRFAMHFTFKRFSFLTSGLHHLLALAALGLLPMVAQAQLKIIQATTPTTETFDGMGTASTSTAATVPVGFQLTAVTSAPVYGASTNTTATTQSTTYKSSFTAGGSYNFGDGGTAAASATDRALGFLGSSGTGAGLPRSILLAVQNTTGSPIQDLQVKFDLEQYRTNANAYTWTFFTSTDGSNWGQSLSDQTFAAATNAYFYPPNSTTKSVTLSGVNLANNGTLYLRWTMTGSSTSSQGIGLDNLVLTPGLGGSTPVTPPTPAATITTTPSSFGSPYCVTATTGSSTFDVAYSTSGTFTGTYQVQLSNANGLFPTDTKVNIIGTGTSSPISATIPANTATGTGYRVRVVNDAPATFGTNNGSNLTINLASTTNAVSVTPTGAQAMTLASTGATLTATAATGSTFTWQYGTSAAGPFTTTVSSTATYQLDGSDFAAAGTYYLVANATVATTCGTASGQSTPVMVTVSTPKPEIVATTTAPLDFGSTFTGAASGAKSFTVNGTGLTAPLVITPPDGFEIRTGTQPFACCAIQLAPANGTVYPTTIEVRFAPTDAPSYQTNIPVTSIGLPSQSVAVSGTNTAPVYPATVSTAPLTNIAATSATTGGTVEPDGGSPVTARGVVWAKTPNPVLGTLKTVDVADKGTFTSTIAGLVPGTTYYVRAYATNGAGTAYGEELTLTTVTVPLAAEPTQSATLVAGAVTSNSVQLVLTGGNGTKHLVLAKLGATVDATPTDATTYTGNAAFGQGTLMGTGNYVVSADTAHTITVSGLRPNTAYAFAVFDYNDNDTPYAENYLATTPGTLSKSTLALPAAMLLEENFNYPADSLTRSKVWKAHNSGGTNPIKVITPSLSYASYGASNIGGAVTLQTSGEDLNRKFAPLYARTPVYASVLVNVASAQAAGDYFFHLGNSTVSNSFYKSRVFVKSSSTGKIQFGVANSSVTPTYTTAEYALGTTYLLVLKYVFDETGGTTQLFINPALDAEPTTADASATETSGSPADIGSVILRQGGATSAAALTVDGIRVGNSYRVVRTGLTCLQPVPAFTATTACVGTATAFTNTSTTVEANATYAWDIDNDGTTDYTTKDVAHTYAAAGVYTAKLTITQGQCSDTYAQQVTVRELPTATLSGNSTICAGSTASLTVHLTGVAPWTVGYSADGGKTTTSVAVAAADVNADGNYALVVSPAATTTYSLTAVADGNCTGSALSGTATVTVNTVPVLTLPVVPVTDAMTDLRGATVPFAATATGSTPAPKLTYSILLNGVTTPITSPYVFPIGTTTVTATATNDCGATSQTFPVTVKSPTTVTVLYQNADGQVANNTIKPNLQLVNNSSAAIPYSELTVRYWLTAEDAATIAATIDWAQVGTGAVKARYVALSQPAQGAFGYVEYSFTTAAGTLAAGGNSGAIQSRIAKQTQTNFNEADDYSYGSNSAYQLNSRITVYRGTTLIGGVEPALVAPTTSVQVLTQNQEKKATSTTISTYLQLRNTGSQPIKYQDLTVRYWFTPEGTQALNSYIDYAQLGNSNVSITFGKAGSETYAELHFAAALGTLAPLSSTGNVQYRLAKADWSNFTLTNDFSYQAAAAALAENTHVTVYQQGQLIYGQEPAGATALTSARVVYKSEAGLTTEAAPAQALNSFPNPFAASTTLAFTLTQAQAYRLEVYDVSGRLIKQLQAGQAEAGQPVVVQWDAAGLAAGFYMVRLTAGTEVQTLKLIRQ